jgi:hypothetical protein
MSSYIQNNRIVHNQAVATPETKTYYVNVDSRFKQNPHGSDTDFTVKLTNPIKNVSKVRVASVEFPNIPYTISEYNGNNKLWFETNSGTSILTITVPDGNYTSEELLNFLNRELLPHFSISLDTITGKVRIFPVDGTSNFRMLVDKTGRFDARDTDYGLGYNLGFRNRVYTGITSFGVKSESIMNVTGYPYYIMQINGYDTLRSPVQNGSVLGMAKLIMDGDKFSIIFEDGRNMLSYVYEFYQPIDFKTVEVKILDPFGEPVFPHQEPMSLTLEITSIMQSHLYEQQRNRMFEIPRRS